MTAPDLTEPLAALRADPASAAVLCDIDGTLSPIVADPEAGDRPAPARGLLVELATRYRLVACVSGRRASAARRMVGLEQLTYAGNHGLEVLRPGDAAPTLDPALGHRGTAAASFASRLDWRHLDGCGLRLEDKGPIQAIHWRGRRGSRAGRERAGGGDRRARGRAGPGAALRPPGAGAAAAGHRRQGDRGARG